MKKSNKNKIEEFIRVDHAGERGAIKIYEGQLLALNTFINSDSNDSLNSVSVEKKFLWKDMKPINYDINATPKSQDLPNIVSLNFAIWF